jgi:hypothetical protein
MGKPPDHPVQQPLVPQHPVNHPRDRLTIRITAYFIQFPRQDQFQVFLRVLEIPVQNHERRFKKKHGVLCVYVSSFLCIFVSSRRN